MNKELWIVTLPAFSWLLFSLGGTGIKEKKDQGHKWIRRFILPVIYGICLFLAHFALWQALGVMILACAMFHLGYGHNTSWKMRLLVCAGYGLISAPIGLSFWNLITVIVCPIMFLLNKTKLTQMIFVWKICEGTFGALIGIQISFVMAGYGLIWIK